MIRAHQPGSEPIDIPETIPNPVVVPKPTPTPIEPAPKEPVRIPEKIPQSTFLNGRARGLHQRRRHPRDRPRHVAGILAQAGDQLAYEAEAEERDAADDHGLDQVEQGAEPDAEAEPEHQGHDAGKEADQEQHGARQAEEQHRLAAEAELEPD